MTSFLELAERYRNEAAAVRRQLLFCRACRNQFSVTSGTVMANTKLPLRKWLFAFHLIGSSKKGISSLQLARMLKVTYKTAWHLAHRIRASMTESRQYLEEYDYRYNTRGESDVERIEEAIDRAKGKRLTLPKSAAGGPSLFDREAPRAGHGRKRGRK